MIKAMTIDEIETMYGALSRDWLTFVKDLHLSNKNLYNLISLKKTLENKHSTIQETVATIMRSHGAEENENGALQLSQDKIAIANKELFDFARQTEELDYQPISIREEDSIPSQLMEILYDFINIE